MSDTDSTDETVDPTEQSNTEATSKSANSSDSDDSKAVEKPEDSPTENEETPKVKKPLGIRLLKVCLVLIVLFFLGIWVLPVGLRLGAEYWLRSQGQTDADIGDIDFNPFTGRVVIKTLDTSGEQGDELTMSEAEVQLRYSELLHKRIYVEKFSLSDVGLDVVINDNGSMVIGGLPIVTPEETEETEAEPWGFGLGGIELNNVTIRYNDSKLTTDLMVNSISVAEMKSWEPEVPTAYSMALVVNESPVHLAGNASPFKTAPVVDMTLSIKDLSLNFLEPVLMDQLQSLNGELTTELKSSIKVDPSNESVELILMGDISLDSLQLAMEPNTINQGEIHWDGSLTVMGSMNAPNVRMEGTTSLNNGLFLLESNRYHINHDTLRWSGVVDIKQDQSPLLTLAGAMNTQGFKVADQELTSQLFSSKEVNIDLPNFSIDLDSQAMQGHTDVVVNDSTLSLAALSAGSIQSDALWNGSVAFWDGVQTSLKILTSIEVNDLVINDTDEVTTQIAWSSLHLGAEQFTIDSTPQDQMFNLEGELTLANSIVTPVDSPYTITQLQTDWQGFVTANEIEEEVILRAEGNIKIQDTNVSEIDSARTLAEIASTQVDGLIYEGPDTVQFASASIRQLATLERGAQESAPEDALDRIARIEAIDLLNVKLNARSLDADRIVLTSVSSWLERDKAGAMEMATWFGVEDGAEPDVTASTDAAAPTEGLPEEEAEAFSLRIGQFDLQGTNTVIFRDTSVDPSVRIDLNEVLVSMGDLNTGTPDTLSPLKVSAKLGKYSSINSEGKVAPLADNLSANMKTSIKQIDLSPLTPYSERFIGYRLKSGVFNGDFDVNIEQGALDTKNDIVLNQLALERLSADEKDGFAEQVGYSVNTALSLLRDNNGDIELSIPVAGSLDDPDISIADIVQTATFNAVKGSVLVVFKPLGAIFDKSNFLKFDPLTFEVGSADLPDDVRKKLTDVSKLLKNKPGIRLTLCGVTTTADADFLLKNKIAELPPPPEEPVKEVTIEEVFLGNPEKPAEDASEETEEETVMETIELTDEELLVLSQQRGEAVKDFLVKEGGVDPERLILCSPGVDKEEDAKPRVDFSL